MLRGLLRSVTRPTTLKTRVIAHTQQGAQQVVRVDHERRDPISADVQASLLSFLSGVIKDCDALLLSDYQKGLLGRELGQICGADGSGGRQSHHGEL